MNQEPHGVTFGETIGMPAIIINGPFDFMHETIDAFVDDMTAKGVMNFVLDLSAAHYCTSLGVATLFKMIKKIKAAGGLLHIAGATDDMIELFTLGHLDAFISYLTR